MALRTDGAVQPKLRAINGGLCPEALASRIWQRRRVKPSAERNPAWSCWRSPAVKVRTKIGGFIDHYSHPRLFRKDLVGTCISAAKTKKLSENRHEVLCGPCFASH